MDFTTLSLWSRIDIHFSIFQSSKKYFKFRILLWEKRSNEWFFYFYFLKWEKPCTCVLLISRGLELIKMLTSKLTHMDFKNDTGCTCKCQSDSSACNRFQYWDESLCKCRCFASCPEHFIYNPNHCCICPGKRTCPRRRIWNDDTCSCVLGTLPVIQVLIMICVFEKLFWNFYRFWSSLTTKA